MKSMYWLVLLGTGLAWPVWAQSDDKENQDEPVAQPRLVVTSDVDDIPVPLLQEAQRVNATTGGASFATSEQWLQRKATNISDLLSLTPGVFVQQRNGAESARLSIRGSGLGRQFQGGGLLLLLDGVPLNTADGSFDFQAIDPWLLDYITVYRGANGMAHGGATLGGVIQLGTTAPNSIAANTARLAAGSYNTQQAMLGLTTAGFSDPDAIRLRFSHFNQQGFREQNQQNSNRLDAQYLKQTDQRRHRFSFYHLNTYAELPSSLSKALITADPRQSRGFNISGNFHRNLTLSRGSIHTEPLTANGWSSTFYFSNKSLVNPVFTYIDRDSDDLGAVLKWQHSNHKLHLHVQSGQQDERRRENEGGQAGAERLYRKQQAQTSTAHYQYNHTHNDWTFTWALQGLYATRDIDESFPVSLTSNRSYHQLNPRFGWLHQSRDNVQWFGNLSRSFEPPSFAELNNGNQPGINAPIKAQSADTVELGSRGFNDFIQWDWSVYYSRVSNEFIRFRFPDGATRTTNADQSNHWGLESAIHMSLGTSVWTTGDELKWQTSYQWNRFQLDDDPTYGDNDIPGIPEHHFQSQLSYQHPSGWRITPNIEWVPSAYFIDLANSYQTENYLLTGISFNYEHNNGLQFYLDIKNLNDQTYISTSLPIPDAGGTDGNYFYSGEGRAFYAGISFNF